MKVKAISGLLLILLLMGVLPVVFNVQLVEAAVSPNSPAEGIYIVPVRKIYTTSAYCAYLGTTFTVEVIMENFTGVAGFRFQINYNSTLLNMTSWSFDTGTPMTPTQVAPASGDRIDTDASIPGSVSLATVWKAGIPTYSYLGNATAAEITFEIMYCPPKLAHGDNTVSTPLAFYSNMTHAVDINGDDIFFSIFGNGYYEYTTRGYFYYWIYAAVEANPSTVKSGEISTITVEVTDSNNNTVQGADVFLFSDNGGTFSPSSGLTDSNGIFTSTFTAPSVLVVTICTITADAMLVEVGSEDQTQVTVNPPPVVGGIYIPTNKLSLLVPYIGLTILLALAVATVVYVKKRKRNREIR